MTNEAVGNTYRMMTAPSADAPGKRIDYLLYRPSQGMSVQVKEFAYGVPNKVPGTEMSYSDHEALYAVLKIDTTKDQDENKGDLKLKFEGNSWMAVNQQNPKISVQTY